MACVPRRWPVIRSAKRPGSAFHDRALWVHALGYRQYGGSAHCKARWPRSVGFRGRCLSRGTRSEYHFSPAGWEPTHKHRSERRLSGLPSNQLGNPRLVGGWRFRCWPVDMFQAPRNRARSTMCSVELLPRCAGSGAEAACNGTLVTCRGGRSGSRPGYLLPSRSSWWRSLVAELRLPRQDGDAQLHWLTQ